MPYFEIRIENSEIKHSENEYSSGKLNPKVLSQKPSICKNNGNAGVYVWGFYENGKFHPLYVGKSSNLFDRLINHYCALRGGQYQMFYKSNITKVPRNQNNPIYEPKCFNDIITYPKSNIGLKTILDNFAFRYVEAHDTANGEKYLTEAVLIKLCGTSYSNIDLKKVLLSGSRSGGCQIIHYKSNDLDEMIQDI